MKNKGTIKVAFVSTFPPRECGIATYTQDLITGLKEKYKDNFLYNVYAICDKENYHFASEVAMEIRKNYLGDYSKAAEQINRSDVDVVSLQHEFNIFGGYNGENILAFLKALKKPVLMTMHTVPIYFKKPYLLIPKRYKTRTKLLGEIFKYVDTVSVMTETSKTYLSKTFSLSGGKVVIIPHGASGKEHFYNANLLADATDRKKFIIFTFGLISPSKGLEYVIKSLPKLIKDNPKKEIRYIVAGTVHPDKPKEYFIYLKHLVQELGLEKNVEFDNRYLEEKDIYSYLKKCDVFITPYYRKEQASSGTLSYALSAGCCIVSTPYVFAQDAILRHHVGELVKFKNSQSIELVLNELIKNPEKVRYYKKKASHFGKKISWGEVAKNYYDTFDELTNK